ncbi:MAG: oligosaccharide flippase family protein [Sphingomonadales bacterium]
MLQKSVRKSVAWAYGGQAISVVTALGASAIIARLLSPAEMGVFAVALATIGALQIATQFDLGTYVTREKALSAADLDSAFTMNALLLSGLAIVTWLLGILGAGFLGEPGVARALQLIALSPLFAIFEFRPAAMLQRDMQFQWISVVGTGKIVAGAIVSVVMAYAGHSYMSLAWGNLAYAGFGVVAYNIIGWRHVSLRMSLANWRSIVTFGLRMMSISGMANFVVRMSDILLGSILGLAALGLYSRATSIATMLWQNIYGTATRVVFVQLAHDYRETGELRTTFLRGIQSIIAVIWPIQIGLAILSPPAIAILFGDQWVSAALPLSLLLVAQFVNLSFGMNWELFVLRDETARQTKFEFIRAVIGLILFVGGCMISMEAAAASRIVEALVGVALYLPHMNRMAGTTNADLIRVYGQSLLLTLVAVLPAGVVMTITGWSPHTPFLLIVGSVIAGMVLWLIAIAKLDHPLWIEMQTLIERLGRKRGSETAR